MTPEEIVARLQSAYDNMGTGTRDDLKEAINVINQLQANLCMAEKWRDNYKLALERATEQKVYHE